MQVRHSSEQTSRKRSKSAQLLAPGMVLVFEPYVWEEGVGGYRAEETVVVTEQGCEAFTSFSYGAFES